MRKLKSEALYETGTGAELFTSREAARFLDYHPVSFRNLVSKGKIHIYSRAGNYPLFLRAELVKYQVANKWASKKAAGKPAAVSAPHSLAKIPAVVTATRKGKDAVVEKLNDFNWSDVPAIRAKVLTKYGKVPFRISLDLLDGGSCTIIFPAF